MPKLGPAKRTLNPDMPHNAFDVIDYMELDLAGRRAVDRFLRTHGIAPNRTRWIAQDGRDLEIGVYQRDADGKVLSAWDGQALTGIARMYQIVPWPIL